MKSLRHRMLHEVARAQADHEQQLSSELSSRGSLIAATAGMILVALVEFWRSAEQSIYLLVIAAPLFVCFALLVALSIGKKYQRPAPVEEWRKWADKYEEACKEAGMTEENISAIVEEGLGQALYDDYADCASIGMDSNDSKAQQLTAAAMSVEIAAILLLAGVIWRSL